MEKDFLFPSGVFACERPRMITNIDAGVRKRTRHAIAHQITLNATHL